MVCPRVCVFRLSRYCTVGCALLALQAVDGVDVLFVGPTDLSVSLMGKPVPLHDPVMVAARKKVVKAARAHGKAAGILLMVPDQLGTVLKEGFTFIAAGWVQAAARCPLVLCAHPSHPNARVAQPCQDRYLSCPSSHHLLSPLPLHLEQK